MTIRIKKSSISTLEEERKVRKEQNLKFNDILEVTHDIKMTSKTRDRIATCGDFLTFLADEDLEHTKLKAGNFCGHRFCPHCAYNYARKNSVKVFAIAEYVKSLGYNLIFLTLTAPNVVGEELDSELKDYAKAFERLFKRKEVSSIVQGYIRKLEVTYNLKDNTYHPHYHILICVNSSYFNSRNYIPRDRWLELWQQSKKDKTITQVDVRRFQGSDVLELTKYMAKDSHYLHNPKVFKIFYNALKGKRLLSFSGIFKDAVTKFENGELDYLLEIDETSYIYEVWLSWLGTEYKAFNLRELTEDEYKKYNHNLITETEVD